MNVNESSEEDCPNYERKSDDRFNEFEEIEKDQIEEEDLLRTKIKIVIFFLFNLKERIDVYIMWLKLLI